MHLQVSNLLAARLTIVVVCDVLGQLGLALRLTN